MKMLISIVLSVLLLGCGQKAEQSKIAAIQSTSQTVETTGKIVINPQFDGAGPFSDGVAVVRVGDDKTGKYGYIDKQGKIVIPTQFDEAGSFSDGLALVRIGNEKTGKYGYIDKQGKIVINAQFGPGLFSASSFSDGLAVVRVGDANHS